jgi:hypothetical protein
MKVLVFDVCVAIKKNPNLLIGWILAGIFSFTPAQITSIYMMSWLNAFKADGLFINED